MGKQSSKFKRQRSLNMGVNSPGMFQELSSAMPEYGLITHSREPVPLRSISVDVMVRGFVADVVSELHYLNEEEAPVETVFVFPLDDEAALYAFEGLIGGMRIEGRILEKKKAAQQYEDALSDGWVAFLLEKEAEASDIFSCILGNLPPGGEATLKLHYVQTLAPEPDGAVRFVLPAVLNPRYNPQGSEGSSVTKLIPRLPKGQLPYSLSLRATLESPYAINRVESKCTLTLLNYVAQDRTSAQISLAEAHQFDQDVELLIYYEEIHRPSALLEPGKAGAAPGSLMGDPALLLVLYPSLPASNPALNATGEFIFLLDLSCSMSYKMGKGWCSQSRIRIAKEMLILMLKNLPLGCYFNIYGFGSRYESFYPKSIEYTQTTMTESLQWVKKLTARKGGTEILRALKDIYKQPCCEGHPRQLFVLTDGEVKHTKNVISEVRRHSKSHRCFSFGIGEGASTALIKAIARAARGSAEFIMGKEHMQAKVLQSLKRALQPAVTGISLRWDLPSGLEAKVVGLGPQVIFEGHRCLIYAQICGQHQLPAATEGTVELQYIFQDQIFTETMKFPLQIQETGRLPVHLLAAQTLLQELEGVEEEEKQHLALETSLSSGVVCSQTAYLGVNTELGKPLQHALVRQDIPLCYCPGYVFMNPMPEKGSSTRCAPSDTEKVHCFSETCKVPPEKQEEDNRLLSLISLQNADGFWPLCTDLASLLGMSDAEITTKIPDQVDPNAWATVLAILWLHSNAAELIDEWQILEAKALHWLHATEEPQLAECVKTGNALLGINVSLQAFVL